MSDESIAGKDPRDEGVVPEKNEFLEPEEHEESSEEVKQQMETGEKSVDVSTEEGREELVESGEINAREEGFAVGAEGGGHSPKCEKCGKHLGNDKKDTVQRKINNTVHWFCSVDCAEKYEEEKA